MGFLSKAWKFIDGNKTVIGLVVLQVATAPFVPAAAVPTLQWIGGVLTTGGVLHKGAKAIKKVKEEPGDKTNDSGA